MHHFLFWFIWLLSGYVSALILNSVTRLELYYGNQYMREHTPKPPKLAVGDLFELITFLGAACGFITVFALIASSIFAIIFVSYRRLAKKYNFSEKTVLWK